MMAEACEEMAEITALADAADLNLGTPSRDKYAAARICLTESNRLGKPVVLDPVGVGASSWRLEQVALLLESGRPDIVRVNLAEAEALLGRGRSEQGVDSPGRTEREVRARAASALAARLGCAVLLTGPVDAAAAPDGRLELIEGGSELAPLVTGQRLYAQRALRGLRRRGGRYVRRRRGREPLLEALLRARGGHVRREGPGLVQGGANGRGWPGLA